MASTYPTSLDAFTNPLAADLLTSPSHSQQHSDINDAVEALEAKVAIGNTVLGTYTAYTPSLFGITIGNGTIATAYCRVNNMVHYFGKVTFGSTTVFTTSNGSFQVPINLHSDMNFVGYALGTSNFYDTSVGTWYGGIVAGSGNAGIVYPGPQQSAGSYIQWGGLSSTAPMTWATGDYFTWNMTYKAA
jgi:hypothetical protein